MTPAEFSPWLFKQRQQQQKLGEIVTKNVQIVALFTIPN